MWGPKEFNRGECYGTLPAYWRGIQPELGWASLRGNHRSLLGELHDDLEIANALRRGPFEDAFQGFQSPTAAHPVAAKLIRFQNAVSSLFLRLNKSFLTKNFEFNNDLAFFVKGFLAKFDAIFSLNQDLLLEIHYIQTFGLQAKWSGVVLRGMRCAPPPSHTGLFDPTVCKWTPTANTVVGHGLQPLYKLHGSNNWQTESGEPLLIMGNVVNSRRRCR